MTNESKTLLARLRSHLRRQKGSAEEAGWEGEALTRMLLDCTDLGWFEVQQQKDTKSRGLTAAGAKRVDFVVGSGGTAILLDSKCQRHEVESDGSITFKLEVAEIERLEKTGLLFGLEVAVVFWSRVTHKTSFAIDFLSRLTECTTIDDPDTQESKPARSTRFEANEVYELNWV